MDKSVRQVASTASGIRRDHLARYLWAASMIDELHHDIADIGAGVGYGTQVLYHSGARSVTAYEGDHEAIKYFHDYYWIPGTKMLPCDLERSLKMPHVDTAVAFEIVEHLRDPKPMLKAIDADQLLVSVPNEDGFPFGKGIMHHHRHYTREQLEHLLVMCGWKPTSWWMQIDHTSDVVAYDADVPSRTILARCEQFRPEFHVAILGLGPSLEDYVNIVKRLGHRRAYAHQVWGINAVGSVVQCDYVWHMDDVRIQEVRAKARPDSNIAKMLGFIKRSEVPVFTSRGHDHYPMLVEYPLQDVMDDLRYDYFNSTAAYAVAYAVHIGVTKLSLFGCDFTYANSHDAEKGRGCVEFWLGVAANRGVEICIPKTSSLMDALHTQKERLYGYDTVDIAMEERNGHINVTKTYRDTLPTADEIEAAYDHSAHPNPLMN